MATTFPRTILPREASWPDMPSALRTFGNTGKVQTRTSLVTGRAWTEVYGPLRPSTGSVRALFAQLAQFWREGTILDVDHRSMRAILGVGTGTPLVQGASQTGTTLITDGWTANTTNILSAGDIIRIDGLNLVYEVLATCSSTASGTANVTISPALVVGNSPADDAAITTNAVAGSVLFRCVLAEEVRFPKSGPAELYEGMTITFRETG